MSGNGNDNGNDDDNHGEVTAFHDLIAGGVAGSASVIVGHPFDTIKVRLQTSTSSSSSGNKSVASSSSSSGSFRSLFKGMAAPLSTAAIVNAIIFASYGSSTRLWEDVFENGQHDDSMHGAMTGEGAVLIERGESGTHEQLKGWKKKRRNSLNQHLDADSSNFEESKSHPDEVSPDHFTVVNVAEKDAGVFIETHDTSWNANTPLQQSPESELQQPKQNYQQCHQNSAETLTKQTYQQNTLKVFTCGSIAGTVQAFVICPMEHIKCRLQVQSAAVAASASSTITATNTVAAAAATVTPTTAALASAAAVSGTKTINAASTSSTQQIYKGPIDCCFSIVKNHGLFRGLYRGMGVTLWRETPAFGLYFAASVTFKDLVETLLQEKDEDHPIPRHAHAWAASALAGGISGAFTWAIIYPFDVIKSRMQTGPLERQLQKGMWTVASDIVKEHGWRFMFRGLGVTLVRAFPVNAIIFPVYEFVLMQLGNGDWD